MRDPPEIIRAAQGLRGMIEAVPPAAAGKGGYRFRPFGPEVRSRRCDVEKDILTLMAHKYDSFTKSERKIVDYVLAHKLETQYLSITDLSTECEVAVSTVSLFCRKLKLAGFNDFKLELARASLPAGPGTGQLTGEILPEDSADTLMSKVLHSVQDELNNACHMLSGADVTRAVDLIQQAGQVVCLGQGNHSVVALAAWAQFSATSPKFKTIQDSHMQTVVLSTLSQSDVVLYFCHTGATHDVLMASEVIRSRGAKLILVTHYANSPATPYADIVLLCGPNEQPFQFGSSASLIAQIYAVEVLLNEYIRRDPGAAERNRSSVGKALTQKCM